MKIWMVEGNRGVKEVNVQKDEEVICADTDWLCAVSRVEEQIWELEDSVMLSWSADGGSELEVH